jgi:hypothetical protein
VFAMVGRNVCRCPQFGKTLIFSMLAPTSSVCSPPSLPPVLVPHRSAIAVAASLHPHRHSGLAAASLGADLPPAGKTLPDLASTASYLQQRQIPPPPPTAPAPSHSPEYLPTTSSRGARPSLGAPPPRLEHDRISKLLRRF